MGISKGFKVGIALASITVLFFTFQNCAGNFEAVQGSSNTLNSNPNPDLVGEVQAQCAIGMSASSTLSQTCFGKLIPLLNTGLGSYKNFVEYAPQYALYSDGATKRRWIYLPQGTKINSEDSDNWIFPTGTIIFKEFSVDGKKIETRQLEKFGDGNGKDAWRFSNYAWTTAQTDAELITETFYDKPADDLARFNADLVKDQYRMPKPSQCIVCHSGTADVVNGFNYLQLSSTNAFNLNNVISKGFLTNNPTRFDIIPGNDLDRDALGYIQANCVHCHNNVNGTCPDFRHSSSSIQLSDEPIFNFSPATSPNLTRIVGNDPDNSGLYARFANGDMPRFDLVNQDAEGIALIRSWIMSLAP